MVGVILVSSSRPSTRCSCFAWPSWTSSRLPPPPSPRAWESPAVRRAWVSPAAPEDGTLVGESLQKWRLYEIMTQCFLSIGQNSTAKLSGHHFLLWLHCSCGYLHAGHQAVTDAIQLDMKLTKHDLSTVKLDAKAFHGKIQKKSVTTFIQRFNFIS